MPARGAGPCCCGVVRRERGQGLIELVATKLPKSKETLTCVMLLPALAGAGVSGADALLGVEGIHVNSVTATGPGLLLHIETGENVAGYPDCGVVAVGHGRRHVRLHEIPCFGRPVRLLWAKRL
jgi:hypothetical protein